MVPCLAQGRCPRVQGLDDSPLELEGEAYGDLIIKAKNERLSSDQNKSSFGNKGTEYLKLRSVPENPEQLAVAGGCPLHLRSGWSCESHLS